MAHVIVPAEPPRTQWTVTTASAGPFAFDFTYFDAEDVKVYVDDAGEPLAAADYTLTPAASAEGGYEGGSVTLDVAVSNTTVTVVREIDVARTTDFPTTGPFNIQTLNTWLDTVVAVLQEHADLFERVPLADPNDDLAGIDLRLPLPVANRAIVWNATGDGLANSDDSFNDIITDSQAAQAAAEAAQAAAEAAAAAAEASETAAELGETNAEAAALAASGSAAAASASETAAETAENNAETAQTAAAGSAVAAAASADAAAASALAADASADLAVASAAAADVSADAAVAAQAAAEAARDLAQGYGAALSGTSTSSLLIEGASKVFTTQAGKAWIVGQRLRAASDDGTKLMDGEVTAYSGTSLTIDVDYTEGSGTHADWNIGLVGPRGAAGAGSLAADVAFTPAGSIASTNVQAALEELDAEKAALSHTHAEGDVTGLTAALAAKAATATTISGGGLVTGGGSLAANRTLTVPKAASTAMRAGTNDTDALTAKAVYDAAAEVTLTDAATIAWNMANGVDFVVTPTGARAMGNPTNTVAGKRGRLRVLGSGTLTWGTSYEFAGGTAPTLTTGDDALYYDTISSTRILIFLGAGNHS